MPQRDEFPFDLEDFAATLAQVFAARGEAMQVALLAHGKLDAEYRYHALKAAGLTFAPLPVFLRGGAEYRRIEPDFVVLHEGHALVIEVDGDSVHVEAPADAQARLRLMTDHGAEVERVKASDCNDE